VWPGFLALLVKGQPALAIVASLARTSSSTTPEAAMYVLVHHDIHQPLRFWSTADQILAMPVGLQLHHALPARDGTRATCLWEADSVGAVRDFIEPILGEFSTNEYAEAENREGIVLPSRLESFAPPADMETAV
jgi:hypothetical protein